MDQANRTGFFAVNSIAPEPLRCGSAPFRVDRTRSRSVSWIRQRNRVRCVPPGPAWSRPRPARP